MNWNRTPHFIRQLTERNIPEETVKQTLDNPDEIIKGKDDRIIYQKVIGDKLIRIIAEKENFITVYQTNKIDKYLKGDK